MKILGISVCSFLPISCLILCSKIAELILDTYQAIAEKQVPKQRIERVSIADSFQNLTAHLSSSSSSFEKIKNNKNNKKSSQLQKKKKKEGVQDDRFPVLTVMEETLKSKLPDLYL